MSATVCNVDAVMYLTGGERNRTMAKIRRIVFIRSGDLNVKLLRLIGRYTFQQIIQDFFIIIVTQFF